MHIKHQVYSKHKINISYYLFIINEVEYPD